MLSHRIKQEQTFENLIQEARKQIPLYTKEWTNFNPSDPAETILENLSAFSKEDMSALAEDIRDKLPNTAIRGV
jgi:hypothetical protein